MSKFVDVKTARRRDLEQMCAELGLNNIDTEQMHRWFYNSNEVWAGFYQDQLACLYGVLSPSLFSETAYLWLTTNELVKDHPFLFVRHSQMIVKKLLENHKLIVGHVSAKHKHSIRWLEWLGVKLMRDEIVNDLIPFRLKRSG